MRMVSGRRLARCESPLDGDRLASDAKRSGERLESGRKLRPVIFHTDIVMPLGVGEMLPVAHLRDA